MEWVHAIEEGLAELHTHLGGSVASEILWTLAHEQGIALPVKDYWEFDRLVTVADPRGVASLDALDAIYHWTELIQSSPLAVERSVHAAIGGAYRSQGITTLELRFNPMKRNRGGERDLDHIILAAIRGLDRASLEYPQVRAGLILMMDRTFTRRQNEIIVEKAIALGAAAGSSASTSPARGPTARRYDYREVAPIVETARDGRPRRDDPRRRGGRRHRPSRRSARSSRLCGPDRIGHGILAARRPGARWRRSRESRDRARDLPDLEPAHEGVARRGRRARHLSGVHRPRRPFTIATDGPEMMRTHLRDEFDLLLRIGASTRTSSRGQPARPRVGVRTLPRRGRSALAVVLAAYDHLLWLVPSRLSSTCSADAEA